jgi:holliday junction DNA helicase RuvA
VIASVRGEVLVRCPDHVVIEAEGVGYRLAVSAETLKSVPAKGREAVLHAHLVARDDSLSLYGFGSEEERELFLQLTSVSGVGPKVAIAVLSGAAPRELQRAIATGDSKRFQAVPGVGKRTADRIIVELRERIAAALDEAALAGEAGAEEPRSLAREGLVNLGYSSVEAEQLLDGAEGETAEELIGTALRKAADVAPAREAA